MAWPTLAFCIWAWEACAIFFIFGLYRIEDKPDVLTFLSYKEGKVFLVAAILFCCLSVVVSWGCRRLGNDSWRLLRFISKWGILPVFLSIGVVEVCLRVFSTETSSGTMLGGELLNPRRLEVTVPQAAERSNEVMYYDQLLGWTVRPNLSTSDGMYFTSAEGVRGSRSGEMFGAFRGTCRIALVGDSHTFGLELKFEDTWGYHLESHLPSGCKVLNFGVGGYSVGQMYLKFLRDVRPWRPNIVILSLSSHSAARTMGVYGLNMFERFIPWAQPRFVLKDQELKPVNFPLPSLEAIMAARSMSDLPFIDYDWFYVPGKWELPRWRYLYKSYLFRSYVTWFPLWRTSQNGNSLEAINHALLWSFVREANKEGTTPILLYLPDIYDYQETPRRDMPSLSILRSSGIDYVDLRPCLDKVNDRFIPKGGHYSPQGSVSIARCVAAQLPPLP